MKKFFALLLSLVMALSLVACSVEKTEEPAETTDDAETSETVETGTEISLWTYPIGG